MFGISLGHLFILLIVVLLFNARRLPELGSALGRGMHAFRKGLEGKDRDPDVLPDDSNDDQDGNGRRNA
jgi:sec-independent protein translocase protein TatA